MCCYLQLFLVAHSECVIMLHLTMFYIFHYEAVSCLPSLIPNLKYKNIVPHKFNDIGESAERETHKIIYIFFDVEDIWGAHLITHNFIIIREYNCMRVEYIENEKNTQKVMQSKDCKTESIFFLHSYEQKKNVIKLYV